MLDKAKLVQSYLGVGQLVVDRQIVDADVVAILGRDFQAVVTPGTTAAPTGTVAPRPPSGTPTTGTPAPPGC